LFCKLASQPSATLLLQSPKLLEQVVYVQALLEQILPLAFCTCVLQFVPHVPQFARSFVVLASQPFE